MNSLSASITALVATSFAMAIVVASCGRPDTPPPNVTPVPALPPSATPDPTLTTAQKEAIPCRLTAIHYEAMEEEGWAEEWRAVELASRLEVTVGEMALQLQTCNKMIENGEHSWRTASMRVAVTAYPVCLDDSGEIHPFWHKAAKNFSSYEGSGLPIEIDTRLSTAHRVPRDFHVVIVTMLLPTPQSGYFRIGVGPSIYYAIREDPALGCVHDYSETFWSVP